MLPSSLWSDQPEDSSVAAFDTLVDDKTAAQILAVSVSKVAKMRSSGDLDCVRIGSAVRVRVSDVMKIVQSGCP